MYGQSSIGDLPRNGRVLFKLNTLNKGEDYMNIIYVAIKFIPIYIMLDHEYEMLETKTGIGGGRK